MEVSLQADRVVGEHWRLCGKLEAEGTSRFWKAEGLRTRGLVAIEFSRLDLSAPDARLRFFQETRELTSFRSPHVVQTIQRGFESDDLAFAVTELLDGEDLDRLLARESALDLVDVAQILDQVCRGITRLDAMRISHRLLEPKHVFVVADPAKPRVVKLLNVGLGRRDASAAGPWSPYVIPGHGGSSAPGNASQIWAIGVMSYRMLTGMLPFEPDQRRTPDANWLARVRLRASRADLPRALDAWFQAAFEPDSTQRFATVEQAGLAFGHLASTYAPGKPAPIRHVMDRTSPKPPPLPKKGENTSATAAEADRVARARALEGLALNVEWGAERAGELAHVTLEADPDALLPPRTAVDEVGRGAELASAVEAESSAVTDHSAEPVFEPVTRDRLIARTAGSALGIHERETLASGLDANPARAVERQRKPVRVMRDDRECVPVLDLRESERDPSLALGPGARVEDTHPLALRPANAPRWVEERRVRDRRSAFFISRSDILAQTEHSAAERIRILQAQRARWRASAALAVIFGLVLGFVLRNVVSNPLHAARPGLRRLAASEQSEHREAGVLAHPVLQNAPPAVISAPPTVTASTPSPVQDSQPIPRARSLRAKRSSASAPLATAALARPVRSPDLVATLPPDPRHDLGAAPGSDARRRRVDPASSQLVSAQTQAPDTDALAPLNSVLRNAPPAARPALLPAAPPIPDTAPIQVYRGF